MFAEENDFFLDAAMEMTTAQFSDFMKGRKEFFNQFYERVVNGLRRNDRILMQGIAGYRDRNIEILSSPYLLDYTKFNPEDAAPLYKATGITAEEADEAIRELKKFIRENCKANGIKPPDFANTTGFRMLLILVMRYYLERGDSKKLEQVCAFFAYSMFYTIFYNYWRNMKPRRETMVYTINNMSGKFKIKQQGTVDSILTYSVTLCANTYTKRIMDCTDQDMMYVIGQMKSRIRDFIKNIKNAYVKNDNEKNAIFTSKDQLATGEDGDDVIVVDRSSTSGDIARLAQQYSSRFFQKPVDAEIIQIVSKLNEVSRNEINNVVVSLRSDKARIPEVRKFYESLFYIYMSESQSALTSVHSKQFLATMDDIYRKGNSKNENIGVVKSIINKWLEDLSPMYRQVTRGGTINALRKAMYQYFVFYVVLRK